MEKLFKVSIKHERARQLENIALRYGLSLNELATRILEVVANEMPEERLLDYQNPRALSTSLKRAMKDVASDRVSRSL
jgi:hypothetical protein